jgi:predicted permease
MDAFLVDLRAAARALRARPALTLVALLTLALGVGATTAVFSAVHAVLLRALPYADPEALHAVAVERTDGGREPLSIADYLDLRDAGVLAATGAYTEGGVNLTGDGDPERLLWTRAAAGFLETLGVRPALGRGFTAEEASGGGARVALITDGLWRRRFAADPRVIGRTIHLGDEPHVVVGVLPADYLRPGGPADIVVPFDLERDHRRARRENSFLRVVGRVDARTPPEAARAGLAALAARLAAAHPETNARKRSFVMTPIADELVGRHRAMLGLLLAAVGVVLLVTCANLAGLMVAAAARRRGELALRVALGAPPGRLLRQLLLESVLLAAGGGALGLAVAGWGVELLAALSPAQLPRLREARLDGAVLAFAAGISTLTVVLFGLAPALRAARTPALAVSSDDRSGPSAGATRARRLLVAAEVALSLTLLVVAGLLVRSFSRLGDVDPGFQPARALSLRLSMPPTRYRDRAAMVRFAAELRARLRALPGVVEAGSIHVLPLSGVLSTVDFTVEGRAPASRAEVPQLHYRMVGPGSFAALGVPLVAGRDFSEADGDRAPAVAIVNRRLAERHLAGRDPLGARLLLEDGGATPRAVTVVGVAGDVLEAGLDGAAHLVAYVPLAQVPDAAVTYARNPFWVVRTAGDPAAVARPVIAAVHALDAMMPASQLRTLAEQVAASLAPRRFNLQLVAGFAAVAVLLAALGVAALTSALVAARRRELGVRLALGATARGLVRFAVADGLRPVLAGLAVGLAGALAAGRLARGLLFGVGAADPLTLGAAAALLAAVGGLAAWLPARRAARTDPLTALRGD